MLLQKIKNSILKTFSKRAVLKKIASSNQSNTSIVNIYRLDDNNVGDFYCGPHHYFEKINSTLDIFDNKTLDIPSKENFINTVCSNSLIIGGGGLLNRSSFEKQMKLFETLGQKGKKTVLWGVGHNEKNKSTYGKVTNYNIDTSRFGLVGVRDYNMKELWVPCVSCMHPILDTKSSVENEVGLIFHRKSTMNRNVQNQLKDFPSISNSSSFEAIIDFISKTDTIVTDSYHAMYWGILMEKKVVAIPISSKFYNFKYNPIFSSFQNFEKDIKKTQRYTGVLEECRQINSDFSEKVFDYLGY
jgi:exopolysaccharide biosynthesis predicted pyruvyltransferase EpsI